MSDPTISCSAWLMTGVSGSEPGHLELINGRLVFAGNKGSRFDFPLAEVSDIKFPWYYFNGGMKFRVGADSFRISFVEPHNDHADIVGGRELGKAWKQVLSKI